MWTFIHKMGSPPWFFRFSGTVVKWLLPLTLVLLAVGAAWGLLVAPPDFRQGNSYRIIYIHVQKSCQRVEVHQASRTSCCSQPDSLWFHTNSARMLSNTVTANKQ